MEGRNQIAFRRFANIPAEDDRTPFHTQFRTVQDRAALKKQLLILERLPELCCEEGVASVSRPASLIFALASERELVS
jgi:hypothetical protein